MDALQRFLAWYLGLRCPRPGEGIAWRFDWRWPTPQWLILISAILTIIFVAGIYRREGKHLGVLKRSGLTGLRLAVFAVILVLLTELSLSIERTGLPIVAVMIDTSASMSLQDQYLPASKASRLMNDVSKSTKGDSHRLAIAQHLLTRNDSQLLRSLENGHQLRLYRFAETAIPLESGDIVAGQNTEASPLYPFDKFSRVIKELNADGDQTRPAPSVKKVLADLGGTPPAAIVLLTDGIASVSDADKLSTLAESVRRKGVPFHIVGLGSDAAVNDLYLYDTLVDEVAFVGDPMVFKAKLRSFGYAAKTILLQLRMEGQAEVLAQQEVVAPADGQTTTAELSYASKVAGEFDFVLQIAEEADESNRSNNAETRHVSVREEKIRVLLADGGPRYEFRFLKQLLERDKSIELSTLLQEADLEYSQEDRTAIPHFPVKKEDLAKFDVLILGDVSPTQLGTSALENIREFVRDKGGSVVLIAGAQYNPVAFAGTPLENLLPFELAGVRIPAEGTVDSFHAMLTLEGQKGNSLFRLGNSDAESLRIWNGLPNFQWLVELFKLKPGARVFCEHPTKMGANGRLPVILMQQATAGKVLFHATDETWRWRFRRGDLYHGRYWIQAIRYLSRGRLIGKDRTAELTADQTVYQRGQPATLRVKFVDEKFIPPETDGVSVIVERKGEGRQTVKLTRSRELPTTFEGQLARLGEGTYHGWVSQPAFNEVPPSVDFRVEVPQRELLRRGMDRADLQLAASTSHGRLYTLDDVDRLPAEIPRGTPVPLETDEPIPLWNRWELLTLITSLLTAEWLLRKRWKLV
jgi:hypothetical protein